MFADLHIHSWYSDGTMTPKEIIEKAKTENITLISISDHEYVDAYLNSENFEDLSGIKIIPGAEIIALMDDKEYHILAYDFDMHNKPLRELMVYNRSILDEKGSKLIENMAGDHASVISMREFSGYERNRRNGGWGSIDYLKNKGLVKSWPDYVAFAKKYPVELNKNFLHAGEVIKIIQNAGGYAVLAHPCDNTEAAVKFLNMGIDGFECYYPAHTEQETEFFVKFCREHDLMITAGGDEHGSFGEAGVGIGVIKIKIEDLNLKGLK